jgi:hypothetical protein
VLPCVGAIDAGSALTDSNKYEKTQMSLIDKINAHNNRGYKPELLLEEDDFDEVECIPLKKKLVEKKAPKSNSSMLGNAYL